RYSADPGAQHWRRIWPDIGLVCRWVVFVREAKHKDHSRRRCVAGDIGSLLFDPTGLDAVPSEGAKGKTHSERVGVCHCIRINFVFSGAHLCTPVPGVSLWGVGCVVTLELTCQIPVHVRISMAHGVLPGRIYATPGLPIVNP